MKKKTFYDLKEAKENENGWLFHDAALQNWKFIHSRLYGKKILDVGCGSGIAIGLSKLFEVNKNFMGFEGDKRFKKIWSSRNLKGKTGDIYKLPFKNSEFDTVYSSHVLEHLEHPKQVVKETLRVSKKRIIHSVPLGNVDDKNFGSKHLHIFNRVNFKKLFDFSNLEIVDYVPIENVHMSSLVIVIDKKK
tara:strand:+ start:2431 stop:3000 length:570 start_codon:yes stop_codon:yes gene_type:complete